MNIVSWNVRGLGRSAKRFLVKDLLSLHLADVCCLQESKLEVISSAMWREIGGSRLNQLFYCPARGSAGGIVIGWNDTILKGDLVKVGEFSLTVDFCSSYDHTRWRCTSVYGPTVRSQKLDFWTELRTCVADPSVPWLICGDFNSIFAVGDKSSGTPNLEDIRQAGNFMNEFGLHEPCSSGKHFTWTNGQATLLWVKLDRFLVNSDFAECFPRLTQNSLPRLGSDHVLIRLGVGHHALPRRQFRFELVWFTADGFHDLVHRWWTEIIPEGCRAFILSKKLAHLRSQLRYWAKFCFGSVKLKKLALLHDLEALDVVSESRGLTDSEAVQQRDMFVRLEEIRKQEETYWKQRSRLQWLNDGDENTKFFHAIANGRRNRNFIPRILTNGALLTEPKDIGKAFVDQFKNLFGHKRTF
ncbi:DNase I-like protein [Dioscorea alata]|uniref:DNase I-like protein n=1 Tax=Dioscorea alata TaxID=55571 RepID=A0ACB7WCJ7_DIOAL|nr:DNase I-like protein [Dioscorea alata]